MSKGDRRRARQFQAQRKRDPDRWHNDQPSARRRQKEARQTGRGAKR